MSSGTSRKFKIRDFWAKNSKIAVIEEFACLTLSSLILGSIYFFLFLFHLSTPLIFFTDDSTYCPLSISELKMELRVSSLSTNTQEAN